MREKEQRKEEDDERKVRRRSQKLLSKSGKEKEGESGNEAEVAVREGSETSREGDRTKVLRRNWLPNRGADTRAWMAKQQRERERAAVAGETGYR